MGRGRESTAGRRVLTRRAANGAVSASPSTWARRIPPVRAVALVRAVAVVVRDRPATSRARPGASEAVAGRRVARRWQGYEPRRTSPPSTRSKCTIPARSDSRIGPKQRCCTPGGLRAARGAGDPRIALRHVVLPRRRAGALRDRRVPEGARGLPRSGGNSVQAAFGQSTCSASR